MVLLNKASSFLVLSLHLISLCLFSVAFLYLMYLTLSSHEIASNNMYIDLMNNVGINLIFQVLHCMIIFYTLH